MSICAASLDQLNFIVEDYYWIQSGYKEKVKRLKITRNKPKKNIYTQPNKLK